MSEHTRLKVLNTRPEPMASQLSGLLLQHGFEVINSCPYNIIPLQLQDQQSRNCALNLDQYSDVIVTSQFAAIFGAEFLSEFWPQWPILRWWAIGSSTSSTLKSFGISAESPEQESNSENLIQELQRKWRSGNNHSKRNVLLLIGEESRGLIQAFLRQTSVCFDTLVVYRRQWLTPMTIDPFQVVILTSLNTAKALIATANQHLLASCHFICASQRIADFLLSKGATKVINSRSAQNESILSSIQKLSLHE